MTTKKASGKLNLSILASRLERVKQGAGFAAFAYQEIATVLSTALQFEEAVPAHERQDLIWQASIKARSQGVITEKSLLAAFHVCQERFLKSPWRDFVFITTISMLVNEVPRKKALRVGTTVIRDSLPSQYAEARASKEAAIPASDRCPPGHRFVLMPVSARSEHEAEGLATAGLDLIRASWNFSLNEGTRARIVIPMREEPINRILLGRCHSLHIKDGTLAYPGHWRRTREPLPTPSHSHELSPAEWLGARRLHKSAMSMLKRHPYPEELKQGLIRYVRALDIIDAESCFLKLWSLAEFLTGSGSQNYDVTIRRIVFLFKDRDLTKQVLEHIRLQRNYSVHEGDSPEGVEGLIWSLKYYNERLLRFHFAFGRRMGSFDEACQFLDLPYDKVILLQRIAAHRKALSFRERCAN